MIDLVLDLDCESQILIQITAESELLELLMILSFNARVMLLKICDSLITPKMMLEVIAL